MLKKLFVLLIVVVLFSFVFVVPAFAAPLHQDSAPVPETPNVGQIALDMALMVTITAFIKSQFGVSGRPVLAIAFGVGVVLWGAPLLSETYPAFGVYLNSFLDFLKVWLGAMGSVDLVTGVGAKIATARMSQAGKITTGSAADSK